jgi:hypothetical protein
MSNYDLMGDPENWLTADELRARADRALFVAEWAVCYQEPIEPVYGDESGGERGYLTAWLTYDHAGDDNAEYNRLQGWSGDDEMIRRWFEEMEDEGPERIEQFAEREHTGADQ